MRPILLAPVSVNHSAPSGPSAIPEGPLPVGPNSVIGIPTVGIRPIMFAPNFVNHSAPPEAAMPEGSLPAAGRTR